jgi:hypothetical protein
MHENLSFYCVNHIPTDTTSATNQEVARKRKSKEVDSADPTIKGSKNAIAILAKAKV